MLKPVSMSELRPPNSTHASFTHPDPNQLPEAPTKPPQPYHRSVFDFTLGGRSSGVRLRRGGSSEEYDEESPSSLERDDLKSQICRLRLSKRSASNVIERWVGEGNRTSISELRDISKELRKLGRFKHALEVLHLLNSFRDCKRKPMRGKRVRPVEKEREPERVVQMEKEMAAWSFPGSWSGNRKGEEKARVVHAPTKLMGPNGAHPGKPNTRDVYVVPTATSPVFDGSDGKLMPS